MRAATTLLIAVVLSACGHFTAKQEWITADFEECKRETGAPGFQLARVYRDDTFRMIGPPEEAARLRECMQSRGYRILKE